jgi:DNA-binding response OmpR family regulator
MSESKLKILCVEDDEDTCELIGFVLKQAGYEVETCSRVDCLKLIHEKKFLAFILDNWFEGTSGVDICKEIRSFDLNTPVIFCSGEARRFEIDKALAAGANAYLVKPIDFEELTETVTKLVREKSELLHVG